MEQRELTVAMRAESGTSAARRLRRGGMAPGVVYGRGADPVPLVVDARSLRELVQAGGHNVIVRLNIENGGDDAPTVMLKEIQTHPLTGVLLNVDFHRISLTEKITAQVPVVLAGEAPGVKQGGVVDQVLREIEVECLPTDIPERMELDLSSLEIGQSLHVSDLAPPASVTLTAGAAEVVVTVAVPRVVEEVAPAVEEEVPAEEAEAEAPAEGAEKEQAPTEAAEETRKG